MHDDFQSLVADISGIGHQWHADVIVANARNNAARVTNTVADLKGAGHGRAVVVSAGPSLHSTSTLDRLAAARRDGVSIVAIDGSYLKCLRAGIVPDYVVTLDPHPTRMVRWFGDPELEKNAASDDYFTRQDLDIDFRNESVRRNLENMLLVDRFAAQSKLVISVTAPTSLVDRVEQAGFDRYWWTPLVDDPAAADSMTAQMYQHARCPAFNTGGNVGTAAWVFARFWLGCEQVAVIGMDLGYRMDLPKTQTQTYYELQALLGVDDVPEHFFPVLHNPHTRSDSYIDPTYQWYRANLLDMLKASGSSLYNCSGDGNLFGEGVIWQDIETFMGAE